MEFDRTGIILYTLKYKECVVFYEQIVGLKRMFENETLTCFEFGSSYLMIELDREESNSQEKNTRLKTCLRMNVSNVKDLSDDLISKGVNVNYQEHSWGTIAKFLDPDGNLCAFKDSEKFEKQIDDYDESE